MFFLGKGDLRRGGGQTMLRVWRVISNLLSFDPTIEKHRGGDMPFLLIMRFDDPM